MVALQPFEGATNRTAVLILEKGSKTDEEVPYIVWSKTGLGRIDTDSSLSDVERLTNKKALVAKSIDGEDKTSPWITGPSSFLEAVESVIGRSDYVARMGACFGATGVFWLDILTSVSNELALVRNVGGGKKHVEPSESSVEWELIYPILRGRDIERWGFEGKLGVLFPQDQANPAKSISIPVMRRHFPRALEFLLGFESLLRSCAVLAQYFDPKNDPFYSIYNVGSYTFAPHKILWSQVADELNAVVVSSSRVPNASTDRVVVPDHSVCSISFHDSVEAHYVCACLNSVIARCIVKNYIAIHPSPNIMHYLPISRYDPKSTMHKRLAELSLRCHIANASHDSPVITQAEEEIDQLTADAWGVSASQLKDISDWHDQG